MPVRRRCGWCAEVGQGEGDDAGAPRLQALGRDVYLVAEVVERLLDPFPGGRADVDVAADHVRGCAHRDACAFGHVTHPNGHGTSLALTAAAPIPTLHEEQPVKASLQDGTQPRPQLIRPGWAVLDGPWRFAHDDEGRGLRDPVTSSLRRPPVARPSPHAPRPEFPAGSSAIVKDPPAGSQPAKDRMPTNPCRCRASCGGVRPSRARANSAVIGRVRISVCRRLDMHHRHDALCDRGHAVRLLRSVNAVEPPTVQNQRQLRISAGARQRL